jgi:hypothetical protein
MNHQEEHTRAGTHYANPAPSMLVRLRTNFLYGSENQVGILRGLGVLMPK